MIRQALFLGLLLAACAYAWRRGGGPERIVAGAFLTAYVLTVAVRAAKPVRYFTLDRGIATVDVALLIVLIAVTIRANRIWPICMTAMHLMSLGGHAAKMIDVTVIREAYLIMLAFWSWPELALLIAATWLHQRRLKRNGADSSWRRLSPVAAASIQKEPRTG